MKKTQLLVGGLMRKFGHHPLCPHARLWSHHLLLFFFSIPCPMTFPSEFRPWICKFSCFCWICVLVRCARCIDSKSDPAAISELRGIWPQHRKALINPRSLFCEDVGDWLGVGDICLSLLRSNFGGVCSGSRSQRYCAVGIVGVSQQSESSCAKFEDNRVWRSEFAQDRGSSRS